MSGHCDVCNKTFAHLYEHRRIHDPTARFYCSRCEKSYVSNHGLQIHIRVAHTKEKPYKCENQDCDKTFSTISERSRHHKTHVPEKTYLCPEPGCGRSFSLYTHLYQHKFSHSDTKFSCDINGCDKCYSRPYSLNYHRKKCHPPQI